MDILTLSDSTFGFGSEISPTFILWLHLVDDNYILCHPFLRDNLFSITKTHKASMEQIADLYTMENTAEATASTSRNTGSRNANGGTFARLQQALACIGMLEQDLAAERAAHQNDLVGMA